MLAKPPLLLLAAAGAALLALMMLAFPGPSLQASLKGISIWWDVLFPALFPFFVISEMMLGIGIVHFFGTLLDPMMRPLFRIPGIGGFVMAIGFASGYPVGARLTSQLYEQKLINRVEGERLVAFTTSSDPIFLIGAVSVGFFHNPALAGILATAHYGSALLVGLIMRFHGKPFKNKPILPEQPNGIRVRIWKQAFNAMHTARISDGRTLGVMLMESISSGLTMSFVIGGLVVFFSVVMEIMSATGVMSVIHAGVQMLLHTIGMPAALSEAVVNGFFEVTLGSKAAGSAEGIPLMYKTAIAAWVLSWGGLSVHAQIVSVLHKTPLRYLPFLGARLIHGLLAAILVIVLWEPMNGGLNASRLFLPMIALASPSTPASQWPALLLPSVLRVFVYSLISMLMLTAFLAFIRKCMKRFRT